MKGWIFLFFWLCRLIALSRWKLTVHGLYFEEEIHATTRDTRGKSDRANLPSRRGMKARGRRINLGKGKEGKVGLWRSRRQEKRGGQGAARMEEEEGKGAVQSPGRERGGTERIGGGDRKHIKLPPCLSSMTQDPFSSRATGRRRC